MAEVVLVIWVCIATVAAARTLMMTVGSTCPVIAEPASQLRVAACKHAVAEEVSEPQKTA